ncbi:hypothetical protein QBC38DRAFT_71597 [Podospora fimiseda]|uniref:Uncharacterized protein n=1 Tax=Podospora fimiseda TaxID=252190 RepID=A0AAN7BGR9_9PEZI|nr:hypothetical protein QBC38DRAFT_71597 [Podospora fimiseda]
MKYSFQFILFSMLRLVAGLAIPSPWSASPATVTSFYPVTSACHSILTSCRVDSDCCSGLLCRSYDGEYICTPGG